MKIRKIYIRKKTNISKYNKYLIAGNLNSLNNRTTDRITHRIEEPLFNGGSFIKILIAENNNNLTKILTDSLYPVVCLFYSNKWYLGGHIKQKNLLQQNRTILLLLYRLKNKIT